MTRRPRVFAPNRLAPPSTRSVVRQRPRARWVRARPRVDDFSPRRRIPNAEDARVEPPRMTSRSTLAHHLALRGIKEIFIPERILDDLRHRSTRRLARSAVVARLARVHVKRRLRIQPHRSIAPVLLVLQRPFHRKHFHPTRWVSLDRARLIDARALGVLRARVSRRRLGERRASTPILRASFHSRPPRAHRSPTTEERRRGRLPSRPPPAHHARLPRDVDFVPARVAPNTKITDIIISTTLPRLSPPFPRALTPLAPDPAEILHRVRAPRVVLLERVSRGHAFTARRALGERARGLHRRRRVLPDGRRRRGGGRGRRGRASPRATATRRARGRRHSDSDSDSDSIRSIDRATIDDGWIRLDRSVVWYRSDRLVWIVSIGACVTHRSKTKNRNPSINRIDRLTDQSYRSTDR